MQPYGPPLPPPQQNFQPASAKKRFNMLIIPLVIVTLLFFGSAGFAFWAYGGMKDYKNNADQKIAKAVEVAKQQTSDEKDKEFTEKEKNPFKKYEGPSSFGSVSVTYPKTWAAYVAESGSGGTPVDGYLYPDFVPATNSGKQFALRVQVVDRTYDQEMKQFDSKAKSGKVKVSPFKVDKVPNVLGARVEGEVNTGQQDVMVIFPIRDKTLKVWTESSQFVGDFNNIILPNLTFVP
jgi:hypothetical protein